MYRIPRPSEVGVYALNLLEGEEIVSITFSNIESDSFNIMTMTGKLFIIGVLDNNKLAAAVMDISDIAGQLPN